MFTHSPPTNKKHSSISTRFFGCNPAQQYYKAIQIKSVNYAASSTCFMFRFSFLPSLFSFCVCASTHLRHKYHVFFIPLQHPSLFDMAGWFFDFTAPSYSTASSALSWAVMRKICMRFHAALHDGCYCSLGDCLNKMNNDRSSWIERRAADKKQKDLLTRA